MGLIDKRLERHGLGLQGCRGGAGGDSVGARDSGYRRAVLDSMRNFQGKFLAIGGILGVLRFRGVGQKSTFNQDGRNRRSPQNVKPPASNTAIRGWRAAGHVIMNRRRQSQTLRAVKISFNAARAAPWRGIEVN